MLTGCVGRVVIYEPELSKKETKITNNATFEKANESFKNFILKQNRKLTPEVVSAIAYYVEQYCLENSVDPKIVLSLMARESSFRNDVVSPSGAIGLGQLLKPTAKDMGVDDLFDIEQNTKATVKYIKWLLTKWEGDVDKSLASYKIGLGTVTNLINNGKEYPETTKKYISDIKSYYDTI